MQTTTAERHESNDLEERDVRALTEYMAVLPEGGDIYTVVGQNENGEYRVDAREGRCTCPDHEYREVRCKHIRRVAFATGERVVPAWVDANEVDAQLGEHVEETPKVAATDGGVTLAEFTTGDTDEDGCWCDDHDFPCFDCYNEGRRTLPGEGE
jgi:hypothetical protein